MYLVKRSEEEIDSLLNRVAEQVDKGRTKFFGMTFEQGVEEGIRWLIGEQEDNPFPDENEEDN